MAGATDAENEVGTALPIEIRRSTTQLVLLEVALYGWYPLMWAVIFLPLARSAPEQLQAWYFVALVLLLALAVAFDVRRRRKEVLRLTEDGLYSGRDDGKNVGWPGGKPVAVTWGEVRAIHVSTTWFSRKVLIDTSRRMWVLGFPLAGWFSRDPDFDERVELMRRTWEEQRGPLPPPPAPPLFLPVPSPPEPG